MVRLVAVVVVFLAATAFAQAYGQRGNGAVVLSRFTGCGVLDADGNDFFDYSGTGHLTLTSFQYGASALLTCRTQLPPPGIAIRWDFASTGIYCTAGSDPSTDWEEIITADGTTTLRCRGPVRR